MKIYILNLNGDENQVNEGAFIEKGYRIKQEAIKTTFDCHFKLQRYHNRLSRHFHHSAQNCRAASPVVVDKNGFQKI